MLRLFYALGSCSLASHIALEEAGADYELVAMNTKAGDQRTAEYLAINPKGRVPALVTPRGVLTETPAILSYIPETHPSARLLPVDAWERAQAHAFNSYLCSTVHVAHAHKHRGYRWADEESSFADMTRKVPENEIACFRLIEAEMFKGPWVLGDAYSVCDGYLFTLFGWLEGDGVDPRQFGRLHEHSQRVAERPAVRKVLAVEAA
ncbi:glutathione S-transferase family protein [Phenylobacterium sp.]|uniref:glutathione S-transferase family protein n=1 Tax=Phenylobacterium sp. TaxID=1871053 RepID=UPI0035618901